MRESIKFMRSDWTVRWLPWPHLAIVMEVVHELLELANLRLATTKTEIQPDVRSQYLAQL